MITFTKILIGAAAMLLFTGSALPACVVALIAIYFLLAERSKK